MLAVVDEQSLANLIKGGSVVRSVLVEVFVEELAKDAELRRAIVHRIVGEVATKQDLENLRRDLEARIDGVRRDLEARIEGVRRELRETEDRLRQEIRDIEARLNERIDKLNERIDRLHEAINGLQAQLNERIDTMIRWVIAFLATTWATLAATLITILLTGAPA